MPSRDFSDAHEILIIPRMPSGYILTKRESASVEHETDQCMHRSMPFVIVSMTKNHHEFDRCHDTSALC